MYANFSQHNSLSILPSDKAVFLDIGNTIYCPFLYCVPKTIILEHV